MSKIGKAVKKAGILAAGEAALGALILYVAESSGEGVRLGHDREKPGFLRGVREAVANYVGEFHPEDFVSRELPTVLRYIRNPTKAVTHEPVRMEQDSSAMPATLVWQGFRLAYRDLPHRITWMEARVDGIEATERGVRGAAAVAFEGGDWSRVDGNEFETAALAVRSDDMAFLHLEQSVRVRAGRCVHRLELDLEKLGLAQKRNIGLMLRGFSIDTSAQHADGMTIKGFGVRLEPRGRQGNSYHADLVVDFKAGPVAFREDPGYDYEVDARVHFTVAGADQGSFVDAPAHYMLRNRERAPRRVQQVVAPCAPGLQCAIPALRGFSLDLHTTRARFVRELQLLLKEHAYNPETGEASVQCDAYVSNMGTAAGALDVRFNADLVFLCLPQGMAAQNPVRVAGALDAVTENQAYPVTADLV